MTDPKILSGALQRLDEGKARHAELVAYYEGRQPLAFLSPEAREQLGSRLRAVSVNIPRLLVDTIAERLRVTGFSRPEVWPAWTANDMDTLAGVVHREALVWCRWGVSVVDRER